MMKRKCFLKYSNSEFDKILKQIFINVDYDYIELQIWTAEMYLFNNIEYTLLSSENNFSIIKINKFNSINILEPTVYEKIRFFKIKIFSNEDKLFDISSDNYGEYTSITFSKTISKEDLDQILNNF